MTDLSIDEFVAVFDQFAGSPTSRAVFRWEALQTYAVDDEDASLIAYRTGAPMPERSIRTDTWLARIAASTLAGKDWSRVRYVEEPRTEYTDWELIAHREAQVVGDRILVTLHDHAVEDFWRFYGDAPTDNRAVIMHYDEQCAPERFEYVDDQATLAWLDELVEQAKREAMPLNTYLARYSQVLGAH